MSKPWTPLTEDAINALPAQLGVYEVADATGGIIAIRYAGGKEPFGIRSALARELAGGAAQFRHEFIHGYMTRYQELLMVFVADNGALPPGNDPTALGRLSPLPFEGVN